MAITQRQIRLAALWLQSWCAAAAVVAGMLAARPWLASAAAPHPKTAHLHANGQIYFDCTKGWPRNRAEIERMLREDARPIERDAEGRPITPPTLRSE